MVSSLGEDTNEPISHRNERDPKDIKVKLRNT